MNLNSFHRFVCAVIATLTLFSSTTVRAQIGPVQAGPPGPPGIPGPGSHFTVPEGPINNFILGDPVNRIPVSYNPTAGPFEKWLKPETDRDGDGDVDFADFNLFLANPVFSLHEYLLVGPGPAWTDWHEVLLTPDWAWGNVQIMTPGPPPGPSNLVIQNSGTAVDFYFDPLPPGTPVDIWKDLFFHGVPTPQMVNDFLSGNFMIRVAEYPTVPEPASVLLGCLGIPLLFRYRLRRSS